MYQLNLPEFKFKLQQNEDRQLIFDELRKKFVTNTPEEWVRQNFIQYLITILNYPKALISIEREIKVNQLSKRCDAVVFSRKGNPAMILEFKAPDVKLSQEVFDQVVRYNSTLNVKHLLISNGMKHFCIQLSFENHTYEFLPGIPEYQSLMK